MKLCLLPHTSLHKCTCFITSVVNRCAVSAAPPPPLRRLQHVLASSQAGAVSAAVMLGEPTVTTTENTRSSCWRGNTNATIGPNRNLPTCSQWPC